MKEKKQVDQKASEENTKSNKVLTIIGIVICVILVPILIVNVTMIVKGLVNGDKVPTFAGFAPLIVLSDSMNPETDPAFAALYPRDMTYTPEKPDDSLRVEGPKVELNITDNRNVIEISIDGVKSTFKKICTGDLIIVRTTKAEDIKVGDVISFFDPESRSGTSVVTHRVVALEYNAATGELLSFRTHGDRNDTGDLVSIPKENLVGRYIGITLPGIGNVAMFLQSTPGLILCIAVPIVLLVTVEIVRGRKGSKKKKKDTDALLKELEELRKLKEQADKADSSQTPPSNDAQ